MSLHTVLNVSLIEVGLEARTKDEVIASLLEIIARTGKVLDRDLAFAEIMERERKLSTGMRHGIAIPHARTDAVTEFLACACTTRDWVEFDAMDGKPCRIFFMTLSPKSVTAPHLKLLAGVSGLMRNRARRLALLEAATAEEALAILTSDTSRD